MQARRVLVMEDKRERDFDIQVLEMQVHGRDGGAWWRDRGALG